MLASAAGWAGTTLWKVADCSALANLMAFGEADWAVISPDGHIDASPGGMTGIRYYEHGQPMTPEAVKEKMFRVGILTGVLAGTKGDGKGG